jgi:hypothetical protein
MEEGLRPNGRFPTISIHAETLAEGFHKAVVACYEQGYRIETPKYQPGSSLGFDAHITVNLSHPDQEPLVHKKAICNDIIGVASYILEVTHGIHNHWKKSPENPQFWNYTYNGRFVGQIPFVLAKIKHDWDKKQRISGRDYFFSTWRQTEDSIVEQEDPPCLQNGQLRFLKDDKGVYYLNYLTCWRSRDELKAWNDNNIAQTRVQILLAKKISQMLGIEVKVGSYIDTSTSLHIYGEYLDKHGFYDHIEAMRRGRISDFTMTLEDLLGGDGKDLKRIIAAQMDAEKKGHGMKRDINTLKDLGYDLENFQYPADWDTWPKEWDMLPDKELLASPNLEFY